MRIIVDSKIRVKDYAPNIEQYCKQHLILDNPEYHKLVNLGKWTGNTPQRIWLYEKMGDELWLPFGCLEDIWKIYPDKTLYDIRIKPKTQIEFNSHIDLYPYQEKAVNEALCAKNGVLVMPCGSGKTQCGLEIISRIGGRALWLTHTQDLLNQSKSRAESVLDCPVGAFGTITSGKVNIGTHITFATVQTMAKIDLSQYRDAWDVIVCDESQHVCGSPTKVTQFYKVISNLSARYKIGLTATPKRADGLERSMFALLGGIIHEVSRDAVADTICPIKVRMIETGWMPDCDCVLMGDGTIDYHKVVDAMIQDKERFNTIMDCVNSLDGSCIVLANRVSYLQRMNTECEGRSVCLSGMGQSRKAKAERKKALKQLNAGELDCIFASYKLSAEGLDVPNLRYVVFATPEKNSTTVIQSAGRVGRKAEGKVFGTVIDFVDAFGMYKSWKKKREAVYKKLGYETENKYDIKE